MGHVDEDELSRPLLLQEQKPDKTAVPNSDSGEICVVQILQPCLLSHPQHELEWCSRWEFDAEQMPQLPSVSTVDPFRNDTRRVAVWEVCKMVICAPLLVLRILFVLVFLGIGYLTTKLALSGWKQNSLKPLPPWRHNLMWGARLSARCILFFYGFHWIERIGKPAPREVAPIVVSNHVSFVEPIFYFYELFPTILSSVTHRDRKFVGTIINAMQVIFVDRLCPESRKDAVNEIKKRAASNDFPRLLIFPEGTTTNGRTVISFKAGAFIPGFPIQPVVVKYPHIHFDVSWGNISLVQLLPRMLLQFHNFMQVHYLPVIYPSPCEVSSAGDFAERVRRTMASSLNVPETEHSYDDTLITSVASELNMPRSVSFTLEMAKQEQLAPADAIYYLRKFAKMNSSRSGVLSKTEFLQSLGIPSSSFGDQLFRFFDQTARGFVYFQEFALATACLSKHDKLQHLLLSVLGALCFDDSGMLILNEVDKKMRAAFSDEKLIDLLPKNGEELRKHLVLNPELVFPLALALGC